MQIVPSKPHWRQANFLFISFKYNFYMLNPPEADSLSQSRTYGTAFASLKKISFGFFSITPSRDRIRRGGRLM